MNKICFVVQRYGLEVNGGAELLCRTVAEHLKFYADIEIVTTCAIDYISWINEYNPGRTDINGVKVLRFLVDYPRNISRFNIRSKILFNIPHFQMQEIKWMKEQGPYSSDLFNYIKEKSHYYDCFIFFTYLYCTTFFALPLVKDRSILIPTAHDEPPIQFSIFNDTFASPQAIIFNTEEEREFVHMRFGNSHIPWDIIGVGINPPDITHVITHNESKSFNQYIIYVGRVDPSKGCQELFTFFIKFKSQYPSELKLLLIGKAVMPIPIHEDIIHLGFVDEQTKYHLIAGGILLIMPSPYESFSIVLLESWYFNRPVIVNGRCEVLKGQCTRSKGGFWYNDYDEFTKYLNQLLNNEKLRNKMGSDGNKYVSENYKWNKLVERYLKVIDICITNSKIRDSIQTIK